VEGGDNPDAAQALVDFLLTPQGQELFARLNFEYPLVEGVALHPDVAPLDEFRLAEVDIAAAALDLDATFDLMERVNLP
jgi:iron(III) transport system substrate-binding protein